MENLPYNVSSTLRQSSPFPDEDCQRLVKRLDEKLQSEEAYTVSFIALQYNDVLETHARKQPSINGHTVKFGTQITQLVGLQMTITKLVNRAILVHRG